MMYKKSANQGFLKSQSHLSDLYRQGYLVKQDAVVDSALVETTTVQTTPGQALSIPFVNFKIDEQTFAEKLPSSIPDLDEIVRSLASNTKAKVMTNIEKLVWSAKQGNPFAQHNLSTLFSIGVLVPKDNRKAFMLMQEAAKQGFTQSQNSLAMMYINGIGVEPDYQSAYFWASASARQGSQEGKQILLHLISIIQ